MTLPKFNNLQLSIHRLLGQGYGVEDIAIMLPQPIGVVRHEVNRLRTEGLLGTVIAKWSVPAIEYEPPK